ncbi:uncharacterized protein DFL_000077 [Arthrobotrys flagrans]|nr:hypothetical protein DFL_000077 [Arthrobotrys flagrans]
MIAKDVGAKIFATVSSEEKRNFLITTYGIPPEQIFSSRDTSFYDGVMKTTQGKGVDIVLNSLAGPLLQAGLDCLAPFGRFIELGKRDSQLGHTLNMSQFTNVASYISIDIVQLAIKKSRVFQDSLCEVMKLLNRIQYDIPILSFGISELSKAFRKLQGGTHIGKIVVNAKEGDNIKAITALKPIRLTANGAYLIVGGLKGIGLEMARWMARQGAKTLILISRSAETDENHESIIAEFAGYGVQAILRSCDVTDKSNLENIVQDYAANTPIRGVIQSAVVLQDSIFENMSLEQWNKVIGPKVKGTKNLHEIFQNNLDFFIILSSATAVLGNSGQTNYTTAGVYQDALARYRVQNGLPAVSMNLGVVSGVGIAARSTADIEGRLNSIGYRIQDPSELFKMLETAIRNPYLGQLITGVKPWAEPGDISWRREPRFASLWQAGGSDEDVKKASKQLSFKAQLLESTKEEGHELLVEALVMWMANIFGLSSSEINKELPLTAFGVDSLVAGELRNWLVKNVTTGITIFDIVQSQSTGELATRIQEKFAK